MGPHFKCDCFSLISSLNKLEDFDIENAYDWWFVIDLNIVVIQKLDIALVNLQNIM